MAIKNVGTLIREARTAKKLSQEQLANGIDGLSGSEIGKAERGEKELTQVQLKAIAKTLGITQKSLLEAPKGGYNNAAAAKSSSASAKKTTTNKTASAKTSSTAKTTAKKTTSAAAKTSSASASKKTSTAKKTASSSTGAITLSTTEKKLVELYREASADDKKLAARILKGEKLEIGDILPMLMANGANSEEGLLGGLLAKMQGLVK